MIERRQQPRFALKAAEKLRLLSQIATQYLDGYFAPQPQIASMVHLPHAPHTNERERLIRQKLRAGGQRHGANSAEWQIPGRNKGVSLKSLTQPSAFDPNTGEDAD
jgi:hypothetical protein